MKRDRNIHRVQSDGNADSIDVAAKYNSPLAPKYEDSPRAYAAFERAAIGESAQIDNLAVPILMELLFGPKYAHPPSYPPLPLSIPRLTVDRLYNKEPDMNRVALSPAALSSKFKVYDTILANSTFLAGEEMTLADLWHGPSLTLLEVIGKGAELSDGSLPNLARWWAAVTASKGWQHVLSLGFAAHYQ